MKPSSKHALAILTTTAVAFLAAQPLHAATITWGAAQNISGDTDVSTAGTLVGAFNVGDGAFAGTPSYPAVAATTVNGVTFNPFVLDSSAGFVSTGTVGNFTLATTDIFLSNNAAYGATVPAFASLSPNYQALLRSATIVSNLFFDPDPATFTLTMAGLTMGQSYQFQWWSNASNGLTDVSGTPIVGSQLHSASAGNTVVLDDNTPLGGTATGGPGGLGQYAIGTFTADSTSQVITFSSVGTGDQFAMVNGFQLRSVPDTGSTLALFGLSLLGLAALGRKAATAQKA